MFSGSGNTERLVGILSDKRVFRKSKMAANNRKDIWNNVYFSFYNVSNEIPTAIRMFLGSSNTTRQLRRPPDVWISCEVKMSSVNRKLLRAIFDSKNSTRWAVSPVALSCCLTPKTWIQPLEIRCNRVYKLRYALCHAHVLPVTGHHLRFLTKTHVGQSRGSLIM